MGSVLTKAQRARGVECRMRRESRSQRESGSLMFDNKGFFDLQLSLTMKSVNRGLTRERQRMGAHRVMQSYLFPSTHFLFEV